MALAALYNHTTVLRLLGERQEHQVDSGFCVVYASFLHFVFLITHVMNKLKYQSCKLNSGTHMWSKQLQTS